MSWLFSRALAAEYSAASCSGGEPSAPLNGTPTPQAFCAPDKMTEFSRPSRFGMTFGPLTEPLGVELLTWFLAGFRARTLALPERVMDWTGSGAGSGRKWHGSLAKYDPASRSWKTAQLSLLEDSGEFLATWPRWGATHAGEFYPQQTSALGIYASESGLLPTLTVCGNYNRKGASKTSGDGLATALARLPTLCARDYRFPGRSRMERTGSSAGECLPQVIGGPLNPTWCEWFMGFPLGWTALQPLEMHRFQEWLNSHGEPCPQPLEEQVA